MIGGHRLAALGVLVAAAILAPPVWSQTVAVDAQALVGQWSGSWIERSEQKTGGRHYLKITKVDGDKVHCIGQFDAGREIPFVATLTGNQIKFIGTRCIIDLAVRNNEMTGTLTGVRNVLFSLAKER